MGLSRLCRLVLLQRPHVPGGNTPVGTSALDSSEMYSKLFGHTLCGVGSVSFPILSLALSGLCSLYLGTLCSLPKAEHRIRKVHVSINRLVSEGLRSLHLALLLLGHLLAQL